MLYLGIDLHLRQMTRLRAFERRRKCVVCLYNSWRVRHTENDRIQTRGCKNL